MALRIWVTVVITPYNWSCNPTYCMGDSNGVTRLPPKNDSSDSQNRFAKWKHNTATVYDIIDHMMMNQIYESFHPLPQPLKKSTKRYELYASHNYTIILLLHKNSCIHQEFQVPKMEVLNRIRLFWGLGSPLHKPYPYSLYRFSDSSILGTNKILGEGIP